MDGGGNLAKPEPSPPNPNPNPNPNPPCPPTPIPTLTLASMASAERAPPGAFFCFLACQRRGKGCDETALGHLSFLRRGWSGGILHGRRRRNDKTLLGAAPGIGHRGLTWTSKGPEGSRGPSPLPHACNHSVLVTVGWSSRQGGMRCTAHAPRRPMPCRGTSSAAAASAGLRCTVARNLPSWRPRRW